jgi:hypothetical protein
VFYKRCVQIMSDVMEAEQAAGHMSAVLRGILKIEAQADARQRRRAY